MKNYSKAYIEYILDVLQKTDEAVKCLILPNEKLDKNVLYAKGNFGEGDEIQAYVAEEDSGYPEVLKVGHIRFSPWHTTSVVTNRLTDIIFGMNFFVGRNKQDANIYQQKGIGTQLEYFVQLIAAQSEITEIYGDLGAIGNHSYEKMKEIYTHMGYKIIGHEDETVHKVLNHETMEKLNEHLRIDKKLSYFLTDPHSFVSEKNKQNEADEDFGYYPDPPCEEQN